MTANAAIPELAANLRRHLAVLCDEIGPRSLSQPAALERAACYVEEALAGYGYAVQSQPYQWRGGTFRNLVVELPGQEQPEEIVVIGAHYDTVPQTPGADDNASAVAALLELARLSRDLRPARTVRLVAFTLEEPPAFFTPHQGSRVYARSLRQSQEQVVAMVALEMLGHYSGEPNSQRFPLLPLRWFYPTTGNFVAVIGNLRSRALARRVAQALRRHRPGRRMAGRAGRCPRPGPLRPRLLLAPRLPRRHGHRHGLLPQPPLPPAHRPAGDARFRADGAVRAGVGAGGGRDRGLAPRWLFRDVTGQWTDGIMQGDKYP